MNLINDVWIPVRRKNGEKLKITPWQITEDMGTDREIIELAAVRPDFNGALIQFLIGLLQTTCVPKGNSDWRAWMKNPPPADELKKRLESIDFAFNLDGDDPRFMQDFGREIEREENEEDIEKLLIDAPGDQAKKQNKDLFIKRSRSNRLCLPCCAQALLTLQANAPAGGRGIRVGLRGGGPVNTIVMGDGLWQTLWNNVLLKDEFMVLATAAKTADADKFPWCAQTRNSENDMVTTPQDVHPAQIYWSMPRRIRLNFSDNQGVCDLCQESGQLIGTCYAKPHGVKYDGFIHPLTPTYKNKDGMTLSVHQHESLGYKHWLGYVQNTDAGAERARVVTSALGKRLNNFRLWAFGYDMDNMKACCWYEGVMPVIFIENETQWKHYNSEISMLIRAADAISALLSYAVSDAMKENKKKDKNYTRKIKAVISQGFWQETEPEFYRQIAFLRDKVIQDRDRIDVRHAWHKHLVGKALTVFDDMSQSEMIENVNAERVAKAHHELLKNLYGKKLKIDILGLPKR